MRRQSSLRSKQQPRRALRQLVLSSIWWEEDQEEKRKRREFREKQQAIASESKNPQEVPESGTGSFHFSEAPDCGRLGLSANGCDKRRSSESRRRIKPRGKHGGNSGKHSLPITFQHALESCNTEA